MQCSAFLFTFSSLFSRSSAGTHSPALSRPSRQSLFSSYCEKLSGWIQTVMQTLQFWYSVAMWSLREVEFELEGLQSWVCGPEMTKSASLFLVVREGYSKRSQKSHWLLQRQAAFTLAASVHLHRTLVRLTLTSTFCRHPRNSQNYSITINDEGLWSRTQNQNFTR